MNIHILGIDFLQMTWPPPQKNSPKIKRRQPGKMGPELALAPSFASPPTDHLKGHFMTSLITKTASAAVLALLLCGAAQAQQAPAASSPSDWRVFGAANITFGGDTMETFTVGGKSDKIKAGESFQIALGAEYAINPDWAVSASIGYHFDSGSGSDGEISFDRIPVEILAHYNATPQFKLGAGFRSAGGAKLTTSGVADTWLGVNRGDYKSSAGLILEGEYFLNPNRKMSLVARFVQEDFTHKASGTKYDGNHFGIGFKAYF